MLVKFHSKAAAEVVMVDRHAQQALSLFGKNTAQGCFTAAELADAVPVLERAIAESKHHGVSQAIAQDAAAQREVLGENHFHEAQDTVDFATHLYPLLEMMRAARDRHSDLTWGA